MLTPHNDGVMVLSHNNFDKNSNIGIYDESNDLIANPMLSRHVSNGNCGSAADLIYCSSAAAHTEF